MPSFILKTSPDRDLYVEWSTVVENMTRSGTRAEFLEHLGAVRPDLLASPWSCPEARLARADLTGSSALIPDPDSPFGGWDDPCLIVDQRGILRRGDLEAYVDAIEADDFNKAYALLAPFEDDEALDALQAATLDALRALRRDGPPEPVPPPGGWRKPNCTFKSHLWDLEIEDSRASLVCMDQCDMRLFDPAQPTPICLVDWREDINAKFPVTVTYHDDSTPSTPAGPAELGFYLEIQPTEQNNV